MGSNQRVPSTPDEHATGRSEAPIGGAGLDCRPSGRRPDRGADGDDLLTAARDHQPPVSGDADPAHQPFEVEFDITVVDGAEGRRLAALQAQAIVDVLTWLHEHATADSPEPDE